jgi:Ca-activated chloride channel family protein
MPRCLRALALSLALALTASAASAASAAPASDLVLILDASGSMWGQVGGEAKIAGARRVLGSLIDGLDAGRPVGLIAYGHRREADCADIEQVAPLAPLDAAALRAAVENLQPKGKTPLTAALERGFAALAGRPPGGTVVLVTDGLETCGGDPCAAVRAARAAGAEFVLHVIGFDVAKEDVSSLECAAQAGGGLYLAAADAGELAAALDRAAAPAAPADGALSVKAVADGALLDVSIEVTGAAGADVAAGRTYRDPATNPRLLPLPAGEYQVEVAALGIAGESVRRFTVEIAKGATVEREVDFSTGELVLGVTRNGALSDAVYQVFPPGSKKAAATGRTYRDAQHNPAVVRLTAGDYEIEVGSVEIEGRPKVVLGRVTVPPRGQVRLDHEFASGTLVLGVRRGDRLVDATVAIRGAAGAVASGRTYDQPASNPKSFVLPPGEYTVEVNEIRGEKRTVSVTVGAGETVVRTVDLDAR